ncbi:integrase/recombinase xerD homolog [Ptychodera flava]|uniref:integrase/recombinase xerD homolog n=1 Tax=Ptychodera flava TaxID=63121 RepID=UPI00396A9416
MSTQASTAENRDTGEPTPMPPGVASLLTNITGSISTVVESKLAQFKRELSLDNSEAIDNAAKKARGDTYEFRKPGNKQQFEHEEKVLDHLEVSLDALSKGSIEKAKKSLKQDIFQVEQWKTQFNSLALKNLCETLPDVMLASKVGSTVSKYLNGWIRWKNWCSANLTMDAAFPANPIHIAVYLRSLLDGAKTTAPLETAVYSIRWAHTLSGTESPTAHPLVQSTLEGCRRILAKPKSPKDPVNFEILSKLASSIGQSNNLSDLRLLCMCLVSFAGFLRISELLNVKINDISFTDTHMEIKIHKRKNDQFREGHSVVIARSGKITCPVAATERYILYLGEPCYSENVLIRRLQHTKEGLIPHKHLGISYTTAKDLMLGGIKQFVGNISDFGTHSFRAGGATAAANSNVNERCLARHGGWKSTSSKDRYIVDSLSMKLDVARSLGV